MKPLQQVDVRLRAERGCPDFTRMLRLALKTLLRRFHLRAVTITPVIPRKGMRADAPSSADQTTKDQNHE